MKKSLVAVGIIVALGVVWTGASWYTGKQLAQNIDTVTAEFNKQLQDAYPNSGFKLVYRDYQGGVFSSTFSLVLQPDGAASETRPLSLKNEVVLNETISHGPLPLALLKKLNLRPSMAHIHSELANTEATRPLFDALSNQPFLSAETRVAFNGDTSSIISLRPLDIAGENSKFVFSGSDIALDLAHDLRSSRISGIVSTLSTETTDYAGGKETIVLEGIGVEANNHRGKFNLDLGEGSVTLKSVKVTPPESDPVTLNNFVLKSTMNEDDKNVAGAITVSLDALQLKDRDLGSMKFNFSFNQLDGEATQQFAKTYKALSASFLESQSAMDPLRFQYELGQSVRRALPSLLKGNPSFTIAPLSWKNAKGESILNASLDLSNPAQPTELTPPAQSDEEGVIRRAVKKLDITFNAPMAMLAEGIVQAGGQAQSDQEREQLVTSAQEQVKMLASVGEMNQLTVTKDDAITSSLHYADNQVEFNGRKLSLAEFIAPFIDIPSDEGDEGDDAEPEAQDAPAVVPPQAQ